MADVAARRVYEDCRFPLAQLVEHTAEAGVARIDAVRISQYLKANRSEVVQGVIDLGNGTLHVGQGKGGEEEEMLLMLRADFGNVSVDLAG